MSSRQPRALAHTTACGKAGYLKPEAEKRARIMRERYGEILTAYRCQTCKCWHVGHRSEA